jgi:hypothetical protein
MNIAYPKTKAAWERLIEGNPKWVKKVLPAEENDNAKTRTLYWLKSDPECKCYVSWEYRAIHVSFEKDGYYFFKLPLLTDGYPTWSWSKQIGEKSWVQEEYFDLLEELYDMFFSKEMRAARCFRRPKSLVTA